LNNSKLISLIKTLEEKEKKQIKRLLKLDYFNQSKDVTRLWELIVKQLNKGNERLLQKEKLFEKLFPSTPYTDIKLRNLMRKLTKIIEDFLLNQSIQKDELQREIALNNIYNERNLYDLFTKNTAKLTRQLGAQKQRGSDYFLNQFELINSYYHHPNTEKNNHSVLQLQKAAKNLNAFYHTEKLRIELELISQQRVFSKSYDDSFFVHSNFDYANTLLIQKLIELIKDPNEAAYFSLKRLFMSQHMELVKEDRLDIFQGILNYAMRRELEVGIKFSQEVFELYNFGFDKDILLIKGKITGGTFYNSVLIAIKLAQYEWAEKFISKYNDSIASIYATDFVIISNCNLNFGRQHFELVIELLNSYSFQSEIINLQAKQLICKTYFELVIQKKADISLCQNALLSFEKYLRRKDQLSEIKKKPILNFVYLTYKMINLQLNPNSSTKEWKRLQKSFEESEVISNKKWLKEKLTINPND